MILFEVCRGKLGLFHFSDIGIELQPSARSTRFIAHTRNSFDQIIQQDPGSPSLLIFKKRDRGKLALKIHASWLRKVDKVHVSYSFEHREPSHLFTSPSFMQVNMQISTEKANPAPHSSTFPHARREKKKKTEANDSLWLFIIHKKDIFRPNKHPFILHSKALD